MKRDAQASALALPPTQPISQDVLREKYFKDGEQTEQDLFDRVARALASVEAEPLREPWRAKFLANMQAGAIGAGRIMSAAGTELQATLINCFVQPVGDCIQGTDDEGYPGIYEALREAAETMRRGGGVGYDFSRIRPQGAAVRVTASLASGPCSYIDVFDRSCATVESAGARRGAQMGVLRIDHPDVLAFITAKRTPGRWSNFNVSVAVTDAFMQALADDADWPLVHKARPGDAMIAAGAHQRADGWWVYRSIKASELWDQVMKSTYDFAEPGILFPDTINRDNNLGYCENIAATNPCVTADTWVMTEEGPAQVAHLIGRRFCAIVDGRAYCVESEGFFKTGDKPVVALATREGHALRLTADHRVRRVARKTRYTQELEWVAAGELRPGDEVMLHDHRALGGWPGDGALTDDDLSDLRPGHKTITPAMERQSSAFCVNLLRRLFDADGMVRQAQDKGLSVRLTQADAQLLKAVQRMLLRLGVASTIDTQPHELVIGAASLPVFAQRVGFAGTTKAAALERALDNHRGAQTRERFTATVESVTADGVEAVYDVTVRDVHAFDANGLYVHNCGEQPLPPYGCCDLGPIILPRFVRHAFGIGGEAAFDFAGFEQAVAVQVRALDNVLDLTYWPLPQQRAEAMAKRRIGVGFTGLGNTLAMLRLRYDDEAGRAMAVRIARAMRDAAYAASVALAQEKGAFPAFNAEGYLREGSFASRLDEPLKAAIRAHGIRNSHLLSIAPTGTVSLAFADNASNGIEPPFSWTYTRKKREADGSSTAYQVQDHAWRLYHALAGEHAKLPPYFVTALEMSAGQHLAMMEAVQPFVDTAISKTVNVPADYPYDDFKGLYRQAWQAGLKGLATYRPNDILGAVLQTDAPLPATTNPATPATPAEAADPMRAMIGSRPRGALPAVAEKIEYWTQQGRQSLYLVVSFLPLADGRERAIEFFMPVGQSGESQQWISASMRLMSLAARGGFLDRALADMRKVSWDRGPVRLGTYQRADGAQVPMWHDSEVAAIAWAVQNIIARRNGGAAGMLATPEPDAAPAGAHAGQTALMAGAKCPECGAHAMIRKDGCDWCTQCGHMGSCG